MATSSFPRRAASLVLASVSGALAAAVYVSYRRDLRRARDRVSAGSRIAETACGPIEYGEVGDGPPLLAIHGAGGGFDQGLEVAAPVASQGFRVIAMSRFGYLETPLPRDASPTAQADAHACLLDALGIERVAVAGASAGASSALQFALRYPERTAALILLVPAAYPFPVEEQPVAVPPERFTAAVERLSRVALGSDFFFWAVSRFARDAMFRRVLGTPASVVRDAAPDERERIARVLRHLQPMPARRVGLLNDLAVVRSLPRYDLERIAAPTLVVGVEDCLYGTYESARYCAETIPDARFLSFETGGHLWVGHDREVISEIVSFLKRSPRPTRVTRA